MTSAHDKYDDAQHLCDRLRDQLSTGISDLTRKEGKNYCSYAMKGSSNFAYITHNQHKLRMNLQCAVEDKHLLEVSLPPLSAAVTLNQRKKITPKGWAASTPYFVDLHNEHEILEIAPLLQSVKERADRKRQDARDAPRGPRSTKMAEPRDWLGVEKPEVWKEAHRIDDNKFGFPTTRRRTVEEKIQIGDRIISYMTKRQVFFAVWEVTGGYEYIRNRSFAGEEFPECVEVKKIVELSPESGISFHQIKNDLNNFRALGNPKKWGVLVQRSATLWNDEDGERILSALQAISNDSITPRLLDLDADTTPYDPGSVPDARKRIMRAIRERRGQKSFRDKLLAIYGNRCAISGCDVVDVLEAAHVTPYLGPDTNHITNGLLLRTDLHTLLDCGLLAIDPATHNVILAPLLQKSPDYKDLHGRRLRDPVPASAAPSLKALEQAILTFHGMG
jgi:hypothetical protein